MFVYHKRPWGRSTLNALMGPVLILSLLLGASTGLAAGRDMCRPALRSDNQAEHHTHNSPEIFRDKNSTVSSNETPPPFPDDTQQPHRTKSQKAFARIKALADELFSFRRVFQELRIEYRYTKALREVFNLAQKQQLLDANVKYEQFRYNVQGDPLNNFYPLLQVINIEKLLPASKQSLVELIRKQIRYLEPPGVPVPEVQTLHDMREGCGVNCIPFTKTLPLSTKIVFGEKQVQYYRLSHRFEMLGEIFDVPEFVALKTDGLTGLMRVEGVSQQLLKDVIALAQTPQWLGRVAFVFIDLNDLGATNYMSRGHTDGDKYLRSFVNVTLNTFRTNDMVFRLAGDEFLGILVDVDEHQAHSIMERLTRRVYEDPETNAIFDHERNILKSIQTELTHVPNLQSLMIALDRHSGLRSQADQIIRYSRSQNTTDQEIFDEVRSASTSFIKQTLKALQRMRPGITAGIVMIGGEHNDLDTLKSVANLEANIAKKIYKYQTSAPNEYNAAKYGHVTAADQRIYQHDPNALPRIAVPKPVPRNNSKMDRPGPHKPRSP